MAQRRRCNHEIRAGVADLRTEASPDVRVLRSEVQNPVTEHQQGAVEPEPQFAG